MLDVGFSEILLTSAIALVVLGPERLPKVARQVGNWMGRARAMARQLSEQLEREVNADELLKAQSKIKSGTTVPAIGAAPAAGAAIASAPVTDVPPMAAIASAPVVAPPSATAVPAEAPPQAIDEIPPAPREPEPVFGGLPPSATTPAAMHASDPHVADSKSPHE
jgi:sec-independent protein translocase protein TatB